MYEKEIEDLRKYRDKCDMFRMQITDMRRYVKSDLLSEYLIKCADLLREQSVDAKSQLKMYRKYRDEEANNGKH